MTRPARTRYLRRLPVIGALAGAAGGAIVVTATSPASLADSFALLGVEQVPDHATLAMIAAVVVGSVCWAATYLLCGRGGPFEPVRRTSSAPRRIAQHPAPRQRPQWPIAAVDIPAPTPRARPLPADLDQPLSAFDPNSIPAVSFESIRRSGLRPER